MPDGHSRADRLWSRVGLTRQRWSAGEFDILFHAHPPTLPTAPTAGEARLIARRLDRSTGAVRSQWDDARSLVLGNQTAASRELRAYVEEQWLDQLTPDPS